jgi:predicted Ser/Thr protein kinase
MIQAHRCPECGAAVPAGAPAALCPKCLLHAGLESRVEMEPAATTPTPGGVWRTAPPSPSELAGRFPQLEVLELLGHGGMGAVYKARHIGLDRLVAVKMLPPEVSRDAAFAERFTREARALARLSHPNIVTVFDFGQADRLYYLVMEYVEGANLRQLIQSGAVAPQEALAIVPQICDALQFAHEEGIVHRDIKPENILLDKRGRVKIADFGLAKLLGRGDSQHTLTQSHQVMGTLRYMAPEQMEGARAVDHRADIYSLGVVFYELLTGELPLGRFAPPSKMVQIDVRLDEIVLRALEKAPELRYQHASDVKSEIETIRSHPAVLQHTAPAARNVAAEAGGVNLASSSRRRPWLLGLVATINLLLAIVIMLVAAGVDYAETTVKMDFAYWLFATFAPWLDYLSGVALFAGSIGVYLRAWWGRRLTLFAVVMAIATLVIYVPVLARYELPAIHADIVQTLTAEDYSAEEADAFAALGILVLFGGIMGLALFWAIFNLVYFMRENVRSALGDLPGAPSDAARASEPARSVARNPAGERPAKDIDLTELWAAKWRASPAAGRMAFKVVLAAGYLVCLMMFFSFGGTGGHGFDQFHVGRPDAWLTWKSDDNGFDWRLHLSSSLAMAFVGLLALAASRRLELWERGRVHAMAWHYAFWALALVTVLSVGIVSHLLSSR